MAAAIHGGEISHPRDALDEWLEETPTQRPDHELRLALGV